MRKYILIAIGILAFASNGIAQEIKSFLSVQEILSGWQINYGDLNSMRVSYTEEVVSAQPPARDPNRIKSLVSWVHVKKTEEGRKFRAISAIGRTRPSVIEEDFAKSNGVKETSFDGIQQRIYSYHQKEGQIHAGLAYQDAGTVNRLKNYLLSGPHEVGSDESLFSYRIRKSLADPNLIVSVRPVLEEISGQMCHVIDIMRRDNKEDKDQSGVIICLAHEKGMLPMKFQEFGLGKIVREITVEQIDFAGTGTNGRWYPRKAFESWNLPESIGIIKYEFNVQEFVPNIKADPNTFRLDFPNGTRVDDSELGIYYTVGVK